MAQSIYDEMNLLAYVLEEGTFTVNAASLAVPNGQKIITGTFANQVNKENFLMQGTGDNALTLAKTATNVATHFNPYEPEVDGALPSETTTQANMDGRIVGATPLRPGEYFLPVVSDNAAIAPKDKLVVAAGGQGLDKTGATPTQYASALETVAANTGGYIRCYVNGPIVVE